MPFRAMGNCEVPTQLLFGSDFPNGTDRNDGDPDSLRLRSTWKTPSVRLRAFATQRAITSVGGKERLHVARSFLA
jgi:hypothetical protein